MKGIKKIFDDMLLKSYIFLIIDTINSIFIVYILSLLLPDPLGFILGSFISFVLMTRSIANLVKVLKASQVARMYIEDGDDDE